MTAGRHFFFSPSVWTISISAYLLAFGGSAAAGSPSALPFLLLQAGLHVFDLEKVGGHVRGQDHLNHQRAQLPGSKRTHAL